MVHRTGPQQEQKDCKLVLVSPDRTSVRRDSKLLPVSFKCKLSCCKSCTYCSSVATKERRKSSYCNTTGVKQATQKLPGAKGGLFDPKRVPRPLPEQQMGGGEVGPSVYPSVENPDLVNQQTSYSQSPTHSKPTECGSRQAIPARPDN